MIDRSVEFLLLTGSVLDQRRMAHFTGEGEAAGVVAALAAHRTADGGYAYALEPDVKGPAAQPLSVMAALEILDQVGEVGRDERLLGWLAARSAPDGGVPDLLASIEAYPRPPWVAAPAQDRGGLLTTARIAGLLHRHGVADAWLAGADRFCRAAIDALEATHPYEVFSVVAYLDHVPDRDWAAAAAARIGAIVRETGLVLLDPADRGQASPPGYAEDEHHLACDFAPNPRSLAAGWFTDAEIGAALDHRAGEQAADGGWPIHYRRWSPAIEQQARPGFTLAALRVLRAWDS